MEKIEQTNYEIVSVSALLVLTAFLLVLYHFSLNTVLTIDNQFPMSATDDSFQGGNSESRTFIKDTKRILECELRGNYDYPFCELNIRFSYLNADKHLQGIDLSIYNKVGIWVRYPLNFAETSLRVHIKHFDPEYSDPNITQSYKYNSVEWFPHLDTDYPMWFPLSSFRVPTWWLERHKLPFESMSNELNNIGLLSVSTGGFPQLGTHRIELEKIEFRGKLVDKEDVYLGIVVLWMFFGIGYIIYAFYKYRQRLELYKNKAQKLKSANTLLSKQSELLEKKVGRDALTGVLNREGLENMLLQIPKDLYTSNDISIAFVDIDYFKRINDTYGHQVGDAVLKELCRLVENNTRKSELLVRWGGEEFLVVCTNLNIQEMKALAEKLRTLIEAYRWPHGIHMTCSFGIAQKNAENNKQFLHRADQALYQAKAQGRNRVIVAEGNTS